MAAVIELTGLTKRYGATVGIQELDLRVEAGEVFGFLGPNGAGKTTTIRCLVGLLSPTGGTALAAGDVIADGPDYRSYWRVLAVEPQRAIVYRSVRHLWRPHPFEPSDPAAVGRVEEQLIAGGVYLDCTWTFVLQPVGAERTRLLIRTRGNYAPGLLASVMPVLGLYDATYGVAQLRAIARRAQALTTTPATAGGGSMSSKA